MQLTSCVFGCAQADRRGRASVVESVNRDMGVLSSCGVVRPGDVLVTVNDADVSTATFDEVQAMLRSVPLPRPSLTTQTTDCPPPPLPTLSLLNNIIEEELNNLD